MFFTHRCDCSNWCLWNIPLRISLVCVVQCVPLATEPGISLIILPLMRILQRNLKRTSDTFLFISHTTNGLLFKFLCNIFIGVRIIKEMPGSVASGTHCINTVYHNGRRTKHKIRQQRSTYRLSPPKVFRLLRWLLFVLFLFSTYLSVSGRCSRWMLRQWQQWTPAEIEEHHW